MVVTTMRRIRRSTMSCVTLSTLLCGISANAAFAQEAERAAVQTPTETEGGIADIIVTAQRIEQSLQRVPVSVTPVTSEQLKSLKLNNVTELKIAVPSLQVGQSNYFAIRGVGTLSLGSLLDQSVGVSLDDVSLGVPGVMSNGLLDDVEQVEVLTGPQGLLFGRNASAGLINVRSKKPVIGKAEGNLYAEYDNRDGLPFDSSGFIVRATANTPIGSNAALRVNLSNFYQDPVVKRLGESNGTQYDHDKRVGAKVKLLWEPDSRLSIYLIGDYSDQKIQPTSGTYRNFATPLSAAAQAATQLGIVAGPDNFYYGADSGSFQHIQTGGASLALTYELSDALTLSNIAAWRTFNVRDNSDYDFSDSDIFNTFSNIDRYNQYSNELRLAFGGGSLIDGQVGLYTFIQKSTRQQLFLASLGTGIPNLLGSDVDALRKSQSYAGFGQINVHPIEVLTLIAGGRVTRDHISLDSLQNVGTYFQTVFGPPNTLTQTSFSHTNFSYRLGAQYDFSPNIMGYATYSTGYKGPSYNQNVLAGSVPLINPETAESAEIGLKTTLFDRKLRLNLAAYYSTFDNLQVQYRDSSGNFRVGNAGRARTKGVEISGFAQPVDGFSLNFGMTVQRAKFLDYEGAPCYPGQGCVTFNAGGLDMPNAPRFTSTLQGAYEFPIGASSTAFLKADYYHRSSLNFLVNAEPRTRLGKTDTLGFSVGARLNDQIELSLFCRNCTDEHIPSSLGDDVIEASNGLPSNLQTWDYNSVRTLGMSASFDF